MPSKLVFTFALLALLGVSPLLTACYTTAGAGQDLQAAGKGITNSAEKSTRYTP